MLILCSRNDIVEPHMLVRRADGCRGRVVRPDQADGSCGRIGRTGRGGRVAAGGSAGRVERTDVDG